MSTDRFFARINGEWVRVDERPDLWTGFWVDLCHGGNCLIDERYFFPEFESALSFYQGGWEPHQFLHDNDQPMGLDKSGLYANGRLIDGKSTYGDTPGHEGERVRGMLRRASNDEDFCKALEERYREAQKRKC